VGGAAGPQAAPGGADSGAPGADAGAGASERAQSAPPPPPKGGAPGVVSRLRGWAAAAASTVTDAVRAEVRLAMMDEGDAAAERARERAAARPGPAPGPINTAANAVAVAKPRVSAWQRRWGALRDVAAASPLSPIFSRLGAATSSAAAAAAAASEPVVQRGRDAAADLRERWETSDSPLVHRIQDATDAVFVEESLAARTLAAIRAAQPDFDMHGLVALVRRDIPPILKAYLSADVAALRAAGIAPELLERLSAMMATWRADGQVMDNTILDLSELEVLETKMVGDHPMVVFQFQIQQINCIRDAKGVVVDGAADDIQSVYYAWAVEQLPATVTAPATWRLRDMMVRGFHAIV
jgi:import inner membrane translocase subunit TIM44